MTPSTVELVATALFAVAVVHTFTTVVFQRLAERHPAHAGALHLLGEVEVVFGFWALVLVLALFALIGPDQAVDYVEKRNFTEPAFVFAIMVVAGSRPILRAASGLVDRVAQALPLRAAVARYVVTLTLLPLLGSLITEPAAMTLAALTLRDRVLPPDASRKLLYVTIGTLFVNISIGGTLTTFAAPPVLMVASTFQWDVAWMFQHIGWKSALAVVVNAALAAWLVRPELKTSTAPMPGSERVPMRWQPVIVCTLFLTGIVVFAHHPVVFLGLLLFYLGYTNAYPQHHDAPILREALLVAFFLAGLVVLGGLQAWWLAPVLQSMSADALFHAATALTAVFDNAALTYLASQVPNLDDAMRYALVTGAVAGGGLTVIANAPNPAGNALLRERFPQQTVHPLGLLAAAALPTVVAMLAYRLL